MYGIVGSGYRSEYFGRIAGRYPDRIRAVYLCRSEEKAERIRRRTGCEATTSESRFRDAGPAFVVNCVDRDHMAGVTEAWAGLGYPVMSETPVGASLEELKRIWEKHRQGARIVCLEQYHRSPVLRAGLAAVASGMIGKPEHIYISLAHDYHAASLIRRALGFPVGTGFTLRGGRNRSPVLASDSRQGAIWDGSEQQEERTVMHMHFSTGQEALYDFSSVQYRTFIRSRHICVRGSRGEWSDRQILYLDENMEPRRHLLFPEMPEEWRELDTQALRDHRRTWSAELAPDTEEDELAIASMLMDMETWLRGEGPIPYPLEEALEDAYVWLSMEKAVEGERAWKETASERMPWH